MCRGATRLVPPGERSKFGAPCSNLRSFGSKCIVLKKVLMTLLWRFGPRQWFGARRSVPRCHPSLRLWRYSIKIGKFLENKHIFKSERHELLFHEHLQFSSTILHGSCTDCQQRLLAAFHLSSCTFLCRFHAYPTRFLRRGRVLVFLIIKATNFLT